MQLPLPTLLGGAVHESLEEPDSPERNTARLVLTPPPLPHPVLFAVIDPHQPTPLIDRRGHAQAS